MNERDGNLAWLLAAALLLAIGLSPRRAQADATVTAYQLTCTSFTPSGTSNSPYVTIYAQNNATNAFTFNVVPVVGGAFTSTLILPPTADGTAVDLEVWGSLNTYTNFGDPGYWDGESFFDVEDQVHCTAAAPAPTLGHGALALGSVLLVLVGLSALRRSAA
jgi:hypothetical protein